MDVCESVHQAFSLAEPIKLSAHEVDLNGPSGACGKTGALLALLDNPSEVRPQDGQFWAQINSEPVLVQADGPGGSGRYWTLHLVQRRGHACLDGTSLGFRHLFSVGEAMTAEKLLPLPVLTDVDNDGSAELVRFLGPSVNPEWGNAGVVLALPAMTLVRGNWVWDGAASRVLAGRLAKVYGALAAVTEPAQQFRPAQEVADAMQRFADGKPCDTRKPQ